MEHVRDAFISYSHKRDVELAQGLQRGLQRLARPWTRRQMISVFRDTTSLSANSDLGGSIKRELARSRYFIYLASPEAAASRWVREEIGYWVANRPMDHFLIAISSGSIAWDADSGDFDWSRTTALPQDALRSKFSREPLWVNLTDIRRSGKFSLRDAEFRDAVAALAAPLHGMDKDALESEDLRQHRLATRVLRSAVAALSVLLVTSLVAGVVAWQQRGEALARARTSASQALAARALEVAASDPRKAAQFALYAEQVQPTGESTEALARAMTANEGVSRHFEAGTDAVADFRGAGTVPACRVAISPDGGTFAYYVDFGEVHVYDVRSGRSRPNLPTNGPQNGGVLQFSGDGSLLVVEAAYNKIELWDVARSKLLRTIDTGDGKKLSRANQRLKGFALSRDGKWLAATYYTAAMDRQHLGVWDTATGDPVHQGPAESDDLTLAFDSSDRLVTLSVSPSTTRTYTPATRTWSAPRELPARPAQDRYVALSPDGDRAYVGTPKGSDKAELWDLLKGQRVLGEIDEPVLAASSTGTFALALTSDERDGIAMADGQAVTLYDPVLHRRRTLGSFSWPILSIAASSDGKWVAAGTENGAVSLFSTSKEQSRESLPNKDRVKPDELIPPGRIALRRAKNSTSLWRVTDGPSGMLRLGRIPRSVSTEEPVVAANADGTRVALVQDGDLTLWNPRTGSQVGPGKTFAEQDSGDRNRRTLLFMPDTMHLVVAVNGRLLLLDTRTWETRQDLGEFDTFADSADISGDGSTLAALVAGEAIMWRWTEDSRLKQVRKSTLNVDADSINVSHGGEKAVVIDKDQVISVVDVDTGRIAKSSGGLQYGGNDVVFSKDVRLLVQRTSSSSESGIQFWDPASGDALGSWNVPSWSSGDRDTTRLLAGPGGKVLSLTPDGTFARHAVGVAAWRSALCDLVPDPLPSAEYDRYLEDLKTSAPCGG
ncbi:TIR domain-containing protein [Streptomyces sp. NPDC088116]|uniref:TIR domain-containing protein n=1 Tax=Streptomyces sp. NPDC088116 TaxID=3365825 RepID=UPI0038183F5C